MLSHPLHDTRTGRSPTAISALSRRNFFRRGGISLATLALAHLLEQDDVGSAEKGVATQHDIGLHPKTGHFPARAKSIIFLLQSGGASQMDLFDPKPELQKRDGQSADLKDQQGKDCPLMASPYQFKPGGRSGIEFSEMVPHLHSVVDDLCVVRSMYTEDPNHPDALQMICTCGTAAGRPALGSWLGYALGTENQNLPAYIVLRDPSGYNGSGAMLWQNGWLPALYRGTELNTQGSPVLNLFPAVSLPRGAQEKDLSLLARLNRRHLQKYPDESELATRIVNYELAARMQLNAEKELDLSQETEATRKLYGLDDKVTAGYGTRCLLARRLVERGVRFVQVMIPPGMSWDHHGELRKRMPEVCRHTDLPAAALIQDLKRRGLLDSTIVLWTGEFGRQAIRQAGRNNPGRDHNPLAFTALLAGGGFRAGFVHGATDELGHESVVDRVGVPDFMATLVHQLGLDHNRMTYVHDGIEDNLTDSRVNDASVVHRLLA